MRCSSPPYEGEGEYIFFSYCHDDAESVYPVIERLWAEGFRVWYDSGIHFGDDWPDVIATHLQKAGIMIAAYTANSADSHSCKNEINYAVENKIKILAVMMEKVKLLPGAKMQLSNSQYIRKYTMEEETFYSELLNAPALQPFRGSRPGGTVKIPPEFPAVFYRVKTGELFPLKKKTTVIGRIYPGNKVEIGLGNNEEISRRHIRIIRQGKTYSLEDLDSTNGTEVNGEPAESGVPVPLGDAASIDMGDEEFFFVSGAALKAAAGRKSLGLLKSVRTGELRLLTGEKFFLDRDHVWNGGVLSSNRISRKNQAQIIFSEGVYLAEDLDSPNGTFLNGIRLNGEKAELSDGDIISAVRESFVFREISIEDLKKQRSEGIDKTIYRNYEEDAVTMNKPE